MKKPLLLTSACSIVVACAWCMAGRPGTSLAKPPNPSDPEYWNARFVSDDYSADIVQSPGDEEAVPGATADYRTGFGTGRAYVTPAGLDKYLDEKPYLARFKDTNTMVFAIGNQDGKDRYSTLEGELEFPSCPSQKVYRGEPLPPDFDPLQPYLEVIEGDVDPVTWEMLPAEGERPKAHVILHVHQDANIKRVRDNKDVIVGTIRIEDIEFLPFDVP